MGIIDLKNVTKSLYENNFLSKKKTFTLNSISFSVSKGEFIGIIGANGSGKTTLLKLISGILKPDSGKIISRKEVFSLIGLGAGFNEDLTGSENVFLYGRLLGIPKRDILDNMRHIVEFSGLEHAFKSRLSTYSSGMKVRLAFSVLALKQPDILLLDEILAVGDQNFQQKSMDYISFLNKKGSTILLVSHDIQSLKRLCSRIIFLKKGEMVYIGQPTIAIRRYLESIDLPAEEFKEKKNSTWFGSLVRKTEALAAAKERIKYLLERVELSEKLYYSDYKSSSEEVSKLIRDYDSLLDALEKKQNISVEADDRELRKKVIYKLIDLHEALIINFNLEGDITKVNHEKKILKDLYTMLDSCHPKSSNSSGSPGFGTKEAVIKRVIFKYPGKLRLFITGEKFIADIYLFSKARVEDVIIGVAIHTDKGILVTGPNTGELSKENIVINGKKIVRFLIQKLPLLPGRYDFSVSIYDSFENKPIDHHYKRYPFLVEGNPLEKYGLVHIDHQWKIYK